MFAMAGKEDPDTRLANLKVIAGRGPNARLVVIEQASHLAPSEREREFAGRGGLAMYSRLRRGTG
jgi:pimeloyl-ACP methyl ester carboxylesterase